MVHASLLQQPLDFHSALDRLTMVVCLLRAFSMVLLLMSLWLVATAPAADTSLEMAEHSNYFDTWAAAIDSALLSVDSIRAIDDIPNYSARDSGALLDVGRDFIRNALVSSMHVTHLFHTRLPIFLKWSPLRWLLHRQPLLCIGHFVFPPVSRRSTWSCCSFLQHNFEMFN